MLKPSVGRIETVGRICPLLELGAGFHNELNGRENIVLNGILLGLTRREVLERVDEIIAFSELEQFIDGREFYVGVLGNANAGALPVIEMDFTGFPVDRPRIASWAAKWGDDGAGAGAEFAGTQSIFPKNLDQALGERMQKIAVESFQALRLRDYARIDLRVSAEGEVYVIEVNPNCYLERNSEFARAANESGLGYQDLIARLVDLANARYAR